MSIFLMIIESLLFGLMVYGAVGYFGTLAISFKNWGESALNTLNNKSVSLSFIATLWYLISLIREM